MSFIARDISFTESERIVNELGAKSFLRFWTWPNLFRDQEGGKEICDLIIVFDSDILLISDKKIDFQKNKEELVAWKRWYKNAITKSFAQTKGAERWIRCFPERLFVDKGCTKRFPIEFDLNKVRFHHILVTHGLEDLLEEKLGYASFKFNNEFNETIEDNHVFQIGMVNKSDPFVHVFTERTLRDCLEHFDTIFDFINYLQVREGFLKLEKEVKINAEGDIIALWYESYDEVEDARNILKNPVFEEEKIEIKYEPFTNLLNSAQFVKRRELDQSSYIWDGLIDAFSFHVLNGTSVANKNWTEIHEIESKIRIMAQTNRFQRRLLGESFIDMFYKFKNKRGTRAVYIEELNQVYLFMCLPLMGRFLHDLETYREVRRKLLIDYAYIYKYLNPWLESLVLIGFRAAIDGEELNMGFLGEGNDFGYINFLDWTSKDQESAKNTHDLYLEKKLFTSRNITILNANEFNVTNKIKL